MFRYAMTGLLPLQSEELQFLGWSFDDSTSSLTLPNLSWINAAPNPKDVLFANINGTPGNDTLIGTTSDDTINGLDGNDQLNGVEGNDTVNGGDGDDTIFLEIGHGTDIIDGGAGSDRLVYFNFMSDLTVDLTTGVASFATLTSIENVTTNFGNDTVTGNSGDNDIITNAGNDTIDAGEGQDTVDAGDGDDLIIDSQSAGTSNSDSYDGGAGIDTLDYTAINWFTSVTFSLLSGAQLLNGDVRDTFSNIENITVTGNADIIGNAEDNVLIATDDFVGINTIDGGAGNDTIMGGGGVDTLFGGNGDDTIFGEDGDDITDGGEGDDAIFGGAGDDDIMGGFGVDNIEGGDGNDVINGGGGADIISGGDGDDTIGAGGGVNTFDIVTGGLGNDMITTSGAGNYDAGEGNDTVQVGGTGTVAHNVDGGEGTDTLTRNVSSSSFVFNIETGTTNSAFESFINFENVTTTGTANAIIIGSSGVNIISTGDGDDRISGLEGADILDGGAGIDILNYSQSDAAVTVILSTNAVAGGHAEGDIISNFESATGSNFDDLISGSVSGGHLEGLNGNDELRVGLNTSADGGFGDDHVVVLGGISLQDLDGEAGTDILDLSFLTGGHIVDFTAGTLDDSVAGDAATIANFEIFRGSQGTDLVIGDASSSTFQSGAGTDLILAGDGDDLFILSSVNDDLQFGEIYDGEGGTDTLQFIGYNLTSYTINLSTEVMSQGGSSLEVRGIENYDGSQNAANSAEFVIGTAGDNILTLGAGDNFVAGLAGADTMDGGAGSDYLDYAASAAGVTIDLALNTASGGDAAGDIISNFENIIGTAHNDDLTGNLSENFLFGGDGNDRLDGAAGDDHLIGDDGADTLIGGEGADILNGGVGFDSVDYRGATAGIAFNVDTGGTGGEANGDSFIGIERYYLSNFNDVITGSAANEFFYGEDGNDTINAGDGIDRVYGGNGNDIQRGQGGNDQLYGSGGADQLNGGTGFDIANYSESVQFVWVNLATGGLNGDASGDTYFGIEAVYGTDFDDILTGNGSANELRGGLGNDTLNGEGGNDRLFGGEGADSFDGGGGADIAVYTVATTGVALDLATGGTGGEANGDSFTSIEWVWGSDFNDSITGNFANNRLEGRDGDDTLNGAAGNDRLLGGEGNDTINGGDGVDTIFGQNGTDTLIGGAGNDFFFGSDGGDSIDGGLDFDTVSYLASSSGVDVNLQTGGTGGDALGDTYSSVERVFGSQFVDTIFGSDGNDTLLGNGGGDYLQGGMGNDSLIGGAGTDSYGYDTTNGDADVINGFSTAGELIYILGGDTDFDTWAEVQAVGTDAGANVIFDFGGGNTLTIVGRNLVDLDAADFDFGGVPPAAERLDDPDAYASEPLTFDEVMAIHQAFAADATEMQIDDALI